MHGLPALQMTFELCMCSEHAVTNKAAGCAAHFTAVSKADTHLVIDSLYISAVARAIQGITCILDASYNEQRCD